MRDEVRVSNNLSEAHTLPSWLYTDPEVLEVEKKELFSKSWQYVGHVSEFKNAGDYKTTEIAGKSVFVTVGNDGEIRSFYNVCSHRAAKLVEGEGNKPVLICPYHAWSYRLDGSLNRAPNMKGVDNFNKGDFCLNDVRLEIFESFIFVNLDPHAEPMSTVFKGLFDHVKRFNLDQFNKARVKETVCHSNWKVGIDNYLECDHCPLVHKSLTSKVDMNQYHEEIYDRFSYQSTPLNGITGDFELGEGGRYYWLYPNMWFSFDPGSPNVSIHQSIPIDHKTTKYVYTTFFMKETTTKEEEELMAVDEDVRQEDKDICEIVQKGLETGVYKQGRFSLTENCVHHFHLLMQNNLENILPLEKGKSLS
ncbi:aromatic ring-hydroxylating oxygenase subunit alpha [Virgibacillus necropolis]|uniref:Rieske (2Fe-2S) protein n=1 Tax=Virgibacillus necropolis TaxID=163877 RepID=A0A221M9V4_9BACI|nr:aromatic ring-hydroxylating dioxygenase subunit alpha [Virgibacillus necropolis]ASN04409.1 Rieske (2Fe-2S) protein [Virgibacillus necropolis]